MLHSGWRASCALDRSSQSTARNDASLYSIVKQPDARLSPDTRHRPRSLSGLGLPVFCCLPLPERACGTTGRKSAPAAPACFWHAGIRMPFRDGIRITVVQPELNRPWTQFFACVPHAMAFSVCSMSPGVVTSADFAQFVRTVARTPTWTVRPCCRRLFLQRLGALPLASKDRHRGEPPHPAPRSKDGSNAPSHRSGMR